MNISIDKILTKGCSKYELVYIVAKRVHQMKETKYYQLNDNEYKSKKDLNKALEEVAAGLIHIKN